MTKAGAMSEERFDERTESLFYVGLGPAAAVLLGMVLVPVRDFTTASNFTFLYLILTIAVAELGGSRAAVATALASALSLDFFLTQPYMKLTIADKHDMIAFLGLAVCGLVAAMLGSGRRGPGPGIARGRRPAAVLSSVLRDWDPQASLESQLSAALRHARDLLPLAGAVLRDATGLVLASSDTTTALRPVPRAMLEARGPVPPDGARVAFAAGRWSGFLDLWGDGTPADDATRGALSDLGRLLAILLSAAGRLAARD